MKTLLLMVLLLSLSVDKAVSEDAGDVINQEMNEIEQKFQGFNLQGYNEEGGKTWDVVGETADIIGSEVTINNVVANTYGDDKVNVTAELGKIDQVSGNMHLERNVIITSEQGSQLLTESLDWSRDDDLVATIDDVMIMDDGFTITGKGMQASPGLENAKINEDVVVRVDTKPKLPTKEIVMITSDGPMVINKGESMARFEDNVVAVQLAEGRTLKADIMEVYFDQEMNQIQKMICIGNVEITQGQNQTYAQKVVYDAKEEKMVLTGRPKIIMETGGGGFAASGD